MSNNTNEKSITAAGFFKFFIPSLFGMILFIIPLPYGSIFPIEGLSSVNIGIGFLAELIKILLADYMNYIALVVIIASAIFSIMSKFIKVKNDFLRGVLEVSPFWLTFRILGAIFIFMTIFKVGPEFIHSDVTGGTMIGAVSYTHLDVYKRQLIYFN